uniref:Uncharacterized protein n=1 Tax=Hordeum vulgare subsp. vulgare TaxID=112509 RepID=M0X9T6_HORVV
MVTTRLDEVAARACHNDRACIYIMKPLEEEDSRRLFFNRVFGSENVCSVQFKEISVEILKKCGGLPLAIITITSLLASHESGSSKEWESIKNSLGTKFATKPALEEMRGILNLSYTHLPIHLRPCFLYLGMYPEDRLIIRDDLVRQWIAEGFVCSLHGADLEDVAKSYFIELINRGLIQPEETCYGDVITCRLHDMMLDLILSKSTEDNFISVAYKYEDMTRFNSCEYKVRRLSLQSSVGGALSKTLATSMSQVRSYTQFGQSNYMLPLPQFKYLQVLAFEFPFNWKTIVDLRATGHLFLLRYLKVSALSAEVTLPAKIQGFVHLETLELHCRPIQRFPSDITRLPNLFHLILPECTLLPEGIQSMKSLRTLHCSDMSESSLKEIIGLSELTNLKELKLRVPTYFPGMTIECFDALLSSIGMLRDLKHLSLECWHKYDGYDSQPDSLSDPPPYLQTIHFEGMSFGVVPKWIGELRCLRILSLRVMYLPGDRVRALGKLPSLVFARFYVSDVSQDKVVVRTGLFPVLECFDFRSDEDVTANLSFEPGAMPKLRRLALAFDWQEWRGATPTGMEGLPCLQDIGLSVTTVSSNNNLKRIYEAMESAFKDAARVHPRHPSVTFF